MIVLSISPPLTDFYNQNFGGKTKKAGSLAILALKVL